MSVRSSPAGPARRSASHRRRPIRSHAGGQAPRSSPRFCSPNTACICRSTGKARFTSARASTSMSRPWPIGWAHASATLMPLVACIESHVFAAERIHADDTPVPVLAKGKTRTGRLWTYVRDDRPFGGPDPPAALFFYSRDRSGIHPEQHLRAYAGLMQADAYAGFNRLYEHGTQTGTDHRSRVLGPRTAQVLRPRADRQGAHCYRGHRTHRCALRHRARDQRCSRPNAASPSATSTADR